MEGSLQVAIIRGGIKELFIFLLSVKIGGGGILRNPKNRYQKQLRWSK